MEDPKEVIVDISSDEEEGSGKISGGVGRYDFGWISRFLDEDDESPVDSDDVVVVGEVILNTKQSVKSSVTAFEDSVKAVDEDDCDCVILEEDPDKPVDVNNDVERDDDLLVVSEKGQVACRDYPHPRHHCAKFPFASTPHESFCDQCHCYVCDSLAPCGHWGDGTSSIDHCHASEKEQFWKAERHNKKKNKNALSSLPPHAAVDASLPVQPPVLNMPPLPQTVQFNMTQNQAFAAQCPIRPCSRQQGTLTPPPGFFVPNRPCSRQHGTLSPPPGFFVPSHPPGYTVPRDNNLQAQNVSHQFQNGFVNRSSNSRRWNVSQVGLRNIQSHTSFKRSGSVPHTVTAHRHVNSSSHVHNKPPFHRNPPRGPRPIDGHGWATPPMTNTGSPGSFPIDLRCIPSSPVPSQFQQSEYLSYLSSYPQSFSQSPNYANPVSSQPCLGRTYTDYLPSEFPALFQQYVDSNSMGKAPPNTHASEHINGINNIENPMHPRSRQAFYNSIPEIDFQSNAGKGSDSSAQPLLVGSTCGDTNQRYSYAPNVSQDASQNISHQGSQIQNVDPAGTLNEPHNVGTAENSFFATEVNNQLAESPFGFDDWFCEDPTDPRVIEVSVPPAGVNVYSPDSAHVGSWSLF